MMDRNELISISYYYSGDYNKILKAINNKETVPIVELPNAITIFDDIYPKSFLNLRYPPLVLYYKGKIELLNSDCIGIVGSRVACEYSLKVTELLVKNNLDKTIVSGLAKGIDACAHQNALKTIGVLGCGIDYIYPSCNYKLFKDIENNGLLISEYPKMCKPLGYHFPFRNRIIAALSEKIYIMQSSLKSGTMTTINEALELGKEVRVLPYDIFNEFGINNNKLINEGAMMIEADEIAF